MKPYHGLAPWYDRFMAFANYEEEAKYLFAALTGRQVAGRILDLGVGSGSQLLPLLRRGLPVDGLDNAAPMLEILTKKLQAESLTSTLYRGDMRNFQPPAPYGAAYSWGDTVHHLAGDEDFLLFLQNTYALLQPGGLLIFTWRHRDYFDELAESGAFYEQHGEDYLLWQTDLQGRATASLHYTAFLQQENNVYERVREIHRVRIFDHSDILPAAAQAGFTANQTLTKTYFAGYCALEPYREALILEKR